MDKLLAAAKSGAINSIEACLGERGCDIGMRDGHGWSALHHAVHSKHPDSVALLLRLGADPNASDEFGGSPLHWACEVGSLRSAEQLVRNGADVNARDHKDRTPLHDALFKRNWAIVELLAAAGADWSVENAVGFSPYFCVFGCPDAEMHQQVRAILGRTAASSPHAAEALKRCKELLGAPDIAVGPSG